jgi:protocatechuate 3,4-dioxygenase beta subunit
MSRRQPHLSSSLVTVSLLLAVCCVSPARAQVAGISSAAQDQATEGYRISGRVVAARSGTALARCFVEITEVKRGLESHTVLTDEDGRFSFDHLQPAKYRLTAGKHGFLTQAYEQHENYSTAIAVGPGLVSEGLLFELTPGAILSGAVTDDAGEPVRQAQVKLFRDQDTDGIRSTQAASGTLTDDRGAYEIADIQPGAYFLSVSARPWYAIQQHAPPGAGSDGDALDVAFPTAYYPDVTESDAATPIPFKGGDRLQADFILHAEHAMHLRIPMSEAAMRSGYGVSMSRSVFGQPEDVPVSMTPDGSGAVEIDGLLPGHYDVALTTTEGNHQTVSHFSADVGEGSAQIEDAENNNDVTVTGKVILSEGNLPRDSGMALVAMQSHRAYFGRVNDAGEFTISVPPGTYEVLGQINRHYLATVSAVGAPLTGRVLTVRAGATPRLQVLVGSSYGRIDGVVMHNGHPASAAMVVLVPDHPRENHILFRRDQSDSDGTFTLAGILPGHYRLVAIERGWELEWANPQVLAPFLLKSRSVDVRGGDHLQGTIELQSR